MYDQKWKQSYEKKKFMCKIFLEHENKKKSEDKFKFYGSNLNERIIPSYFFS